MSTRPQLAEAQPGDRGLLLGRGPDLGHPLAGGARAQLVEDRRRRAPGRAHDVAEAHPLAVRAVQREQLRRLRVIGRGRALLPSLQR